MTVSSTPPRNDSSLGPEDHANQSCGVIVPSAEPAPLNGDLMLCLLNTTTCSNLYPLSESAVKAAFSLSSPAPVIGLAHAVSSIAAPKTAAVALYLHPLFPHIFALIFAITFTLSFAIIPAITFTLSSVLTFTLSFVLTFTLSFAIIPAITFTLLRSQSNFK